MAKPPRTPKAKILAQIPAARARQARARKASQRAASASYDRRTSRIMMELTSGYVVGFPTAGERIMPSSAPRPGPPPPRRRRQSVLTNLTNYIVDVIFHGGPPRTPAISTERGRI